MEWGTVSASTSDLLSWRSSGHHRRGGVPYECDFFAFILVRPSLRRGHTLLATPESTVTSMISSINSTASFSPLTLSAWFSSLDCSNLLLSFCSQCCIRPVFGTHVRASRAACSPQWDDNTCHSKTRLVTWYFVDVLGRVAKQLTQSAHLNQNSCPLLLVFRHMQLGSYRCPWSLWLSCEPIRGSRP